MHQHDDRSSVDRHEHLRPGMRIELVRAHDGYTRLRQGDRGTVVAVDYLGTVHVAWDSGSKLGLVSGLDEYRVIGEDA